MLRKSGLLIVLVSFCFRGYSQLGTEVFLFCLSDSGGVLSISDPKNISDTPGYDNQPSFTKDNDLLYSSQVGDQMDIVKYDLKAGKKVFLTHTTASEFSPTQTPDGRSFSTITLEKSGRQLLWEYPLNKPGDGKVLIPYLKIGYHTWLNEQVLYAFVLGEHMTLQKIDFNDQTAEILAEDIGRSLHMVPGTGKLSYVHKLDDDWLIKTYDAQNDTTINLASTLPDVEDMCWYDSATLLMGKDHLLYQWSSSTDWVQVADFSQWDMTGITRLVVSPDKKRLAVVVAE